MYPFIQRIYTNTFLRHNAISFIGSFIVSALNYLYYPVLGRLLPTAQFGEVQVLVSMSLQATIFLAVVTNVAVNIVANEKDPVVRDRIVYELERLALWVVLAGLAVAFLCLPWLEDFFQFSDHWPFIILGLSLVFTASGALRTAYLRGVAAFGQMSVTGILSSAVKLVASTLFVLAGLGTSGAIGGLVAAQIIAFAYAAYAARKLGFRPPRAPLWRRLDLSLIRPQLPYALLVLVVSVVTTTQFSFDILVVKHYFPAEVAGAYAGIATIARIIYFLTGSVAGVLLSTVKREASDAANRALLVRSMALQAILGGTALLVFALAPQLVTRLLIGSKYLSLSGLLPELSLALFVIAFINLLLTYDLALRRVSSAVVAILGALITAAFVGFNHGSPQAVVHALLLSSLIMLGIQGLDSVRRSYAGSLARRLQHH